MRDGLPEVFCWTRFGTEAGETIEAILERKDRERRETNGIFFWGIGNSVAPAMIELLRRVALPEVLFSPIRNLPRQVDVTPARVVEYRTAITMDGRRADMPSTVHVHGGSGCEKMNARYALVCRSDEPLTLGDHGALGFKSLSNLVSGSLLGASQVTAVVCRTELADVDGRRYVVAMRARLVEPFFVRLADPVPLDRLVESHYEPRRGTVTAPYQDRIATRMPPARNLPISTPKRAVSGRERGNAAGIE